MLVSEILMLGAMPNWKTGMKPQALYSQETQDD